MKTSILCAFAITLSACSGGATLSLSARTGAAATTARAGSTPGSSALTLANGIVLTRVRVVISELKLETVASAATADAGPADSDGGQAENQEDEVEAGPFLLDLTGATLEGGPVQKVLDASFKPGTYREIKFKIHKPGSSESAVAVNAAVKAMADANASIIVDGKIDGADFTFVSAVEVQQESEGTFDLKAGSNLTLNVDETNWFGSGTARLDPRDAANRSQIENNIKASFHAFKDDDHNGHED